MAARAGPQARTLLAVPEKGKMAMSIRQCERVHQPARCHIKGAASKAYSVGRVMRYLFISEPDSSVASVTRGEAVESWERGDGGGGRSRKRVGD